jgi:hypothetical protein
MHRAIREINRPCAMADRDRQYRMHQEALRRIQSGKLHLLSPASGDRTPRHSPSGLRKRADPLPREQPKTPGRLLVEQRPLALRDNLPPVDVDPKRRPSRIKPAKYSYGFESSIAAMNAAPAAKHPPC